MPTILVITVVISSAVLTLSLRAEKRYTATAKLLFRDPGFDEKLFGSSLLAPLKDPDREAATNLGLVSLDTITKRTAAATSSRRRSVCRRPPARAGRIA